MFFVIFMLFSTFYVVVWRPRRPGDHIDCFISCRPPINGTWHIRWAASSGTVAAIGGRHWARSCVFVVRSVVYDNKADTIKSLLRPRRRLCCFLRRQWKRRYEFIDFAPAAVSLSFALLSMTMKLIRFNHVGNQHGLPFIGLLQSGDQPRLLLIYWL